MYWQYKNGAATGVNPFERRLDKDILSEMRVTDLQYNSYYIAGKAGNEIYLGNSTSPAILLALKGDTLEQKILRWPGVPIHANKIRICSPFLYVEDLVSYKIFQADLEDLNVKVTPFDSIFFSEAIPLNSNSIVRRTFGEKKHEYIFTKESILPEYVTHACDLLEKQIDGLFCTDGMLHYDQASYRMTYIYFYRNQFFCMDTSLNLLFKGNTIDTISHARIKVAHIESENSITLAGPPAIVNRRSYVFQNKLFVNSSLMGKHEKQDEFDNVSVIDVYDLDRNGNYLLSFYLPDYKGHKMKMFAVFQNRLIAIHDRYLISYTMNSDHFN